MFKKIIALALFALMAMTAQARSFAVGECVGTPVMVVKEANKIIPEPVVIYPGAFSTWAAQTLMTNTPFYIRDVEKGRALLVVAPGIEEDPNAGKAIGWIEFKYLRPLPEVNCR